MYTRPSGLKTLKLDDLVQVVKLTRVDTPHPARHVGIPTIRNVGLLEPLPVMQGRV
nr:P7 protein [Barley yellow dwarf virus PAV]